MKQSICSLQFDRIGDRSVEKKSYKIPCRNVPISNDGIEILPPVLQLIDYHDDLFTAYRGGNEEARWKKLIKNWMFRCWIIEIISANPLQLLLDWRLSIGMKTGLNHDSWMKEYTGDFQIYVFSLNLYKKITYFRSPLKCWLLLKIWL